VSQVQSIEELRFEGDHLVVDAVVDDMVVRYAQTAFEPAEWGPALCRGTLYFSDEDLIPATDAELRAMLTDRVDDWTPLDTSDWDV
jgi:hypothetical protein